MFTKIDNTVASNQMKNYYDILDLTQDASKMQIKEAYRSLAKKYHPDSNNGSDQQSDLLKEVNEAKDVLGDKFKKLEYDQSLIQYKLSQIFNHQSQPPQSDYFAKGSDREYSVRMQKPAIILGLFLLLAIFMLYLFPIKDNEWEMAQVDNTNATEVYYASNGVDDLFGREGNTQPATYQINETAQILEPLEKSEKTFVATPIESTERLNEDNNALTAERLTVAASPAKNIVATLPVKLLKTSTVNLNEIHATKKQTESILHLPTKDVMPDISKETVLPIKPIITKKPSYTMNEQDMAKVLSRLEVQKLRFNNTTKCIQIAKTGTSNVANAFDMADFLTRSGYAISGRKIVGSSNKGVAIDIEKSGCITLIIGSM